VLSSISGEPVDEMLKGVWPFIIMVILLGVVTYIPEISMFLPNRVYGG
jgi:C4-dicarboxylate transporter DctM subunit